MKKRKRVLLQFLIIGVFSFLSFILHGSNAPVTKIASVISAVSGEEVSVPVTVSGFNNIGGFTLALDYEYAKLHFVSGSVNSLLGGTCNIGDIDLGNGFHRLTISWYNSVADGISLADGSTIVDYVFKFISSPATLTWYDMGPSCVYNDPAANTLNDTPMSDYYFNGLVTDSALPKPSITANGPITFMEGSDVTLTSSAALAYLWSTGDTTSSIVVNTTGTYSVQTKDETGLVSEPSDPVEVSVIAVGNTQLEFRLSNPSIIYNSVNNYLEFDVQVKASVLGTWLLKGEINLEFNRMTLSSKQTNWLARPDSLIVAKNSLGNKKYETELSVSESVLRIDFQADVNAKNLPATEIDYVEITSEYLTLVSVRGVLISNSGITGIDFKENEMNGKQFYKISSAPWYESYKTTNKYDPSEILDITDLLTSVVYDSFSETLNVYTNQHKQLIIDGDIGKNTMAYLYDLQGRLLIAKKLNSNSQNRIGISGMKSGIYVLLVSDNRITKSFKVPVRN